MYRADTDFPTVEDIYKISNMQGFDSLKVLQLDNNNISIIENLNHLKNLERLGMEDFDSWCADVSRDKSS